jgi:hypothetical protein
MMKAIHDYQTLAAYPDDGIQVFTILFPANANSVKTIHTIKEYDISVRN